MYFSPLSSPEVPSVGKAVGTLVGSNSTNHLVKGFGHFQSSQSVAMPHAGRFPRGALTHKHRGTDSGTEGGTGSPRRLGGNPHQSGPAASGRRIWKTWYIYRKLHHTQDREWDIPKSGWWLLLGREGHRWTSTQSVRFHVFLRKSLAPAERVAVQTPWQRPQWKSGGAEKEEAEVKPEVSNSKAKQRVKIKAKGGKRKKRLEKHENG